MSGYPRLDETGLNTLAQALANATEQQGIIKVCETEAEWQTLSQAEKDDPNIYWVRPWADTVAFATDKTPVGAVLSVATGKTGDGISGITTPTGTFPTADYLVCNGQSVSVATYPALATYFQTRYGSTYYFGGSGASFSLPNWSSDFPSNGVLVMKARESSNAITFAEIDDTSVSEDKLWSSDKTNTEITTLRDKAIGTPGSAITNITTYAQLEDILNTKLASMATYTIENMSFVIGAVFTEFPLGGHYGVQIYKGSSNNYGSVILQGYHDGELIVMNKLAASAPHWRIANYSKYSVTSVSPVSGVSIDSGSRIRLSKIGNTVQGTLVITGSSANISSSTKLFEVPAGYRPAATAWDTGSIYVPTGTNNIYMYGGSCVSVHTDGGVYQSVSASNFNGKLQSQFCYTTI